MKARAPGCSGNRPFKPSTVPVRHVCAEISETHFVRLSPQAFNRSRELLQAGQFVENEYDDGISSCDSFAGIDIPVSLYSPNCCMECSKSITSIDPDVLFHSQF